LAQRRWARGRNRGSIVIALWLCLLSTFLIFYHRGELWLVLLVPAILLHLYIAYRIRPSAIPR
jgi:hypothetical protein